MTSAPRTGWYPDPGGRSDTFRWWNGGDWTEHTSGTPHAPEPAVTEPPRPGRRSRARQVVALVLVLALVASAGVGVGLWLWRDDAAPGDQRANGRSDPAPGGSVVPPGGRLDQRTRTATIGQATMTLPDSPYVLRDDPWPVSGLFDAAFLAEAPVHPSYADGRTWSAIVALAWLDPDLVGSRLYQDTAAAVYRIAKQLYGQHTTTKITDLQADAQSVDGYSGVMATAKVHYGIKGLPSRYDLVAAHLVRLGDGVVVVALMSVPDDAHPQVLKAAEKSLASLRAS